MRDNFNRQLEDLYSSVKYMGSLCEKAIENASQTVVGDNADKIKEYGCLAEIRCGEPVVSLSINEGMMIVNGDYQADFVVNCTYA